jgi:hypothetical protein
VLDSRARDVALDARIQLDRWRQLEIVVSQGRRLEALGELPGPWIYTASRTALHKVL